VGHHKSGTTALYQMLRGHPQIYMPALKEPRFFAPDLRALLGSNGSLPETWEDYLALFAAARPEQRAGEASPSYLRSQVAAGLIAQARPDARIVAILREPASFVRSLHLHLLKEGVETEPDLARAFAAESIVRGGRRVLRYSDHVRYTEQLRRYHAEFAPEQVLVLIYDDFRADNAATVRGVLRFLDVDDSLPVEVTRANPTVLMRSQQLDDLVHSISVGRGPLSAMVKTAIKALTPRRLRQDALHLTLRRVVHRAPPAPDEQLMLELRRRFKAEVSSLSEYLDRDLVKLWGYDNLA